jgi:hypothetical protein
MMAEKARSKAGLDGAAGFFAVAQFLADALEDQHVGIDRHAHGQHDAGDARQRQRGADADSTATASSTFTASAMLAKTPNRP